ncbi:hypothetical protein AVEN_137466-1 [Araneus ventricosus]|uniref:Uncharacterized protein n=1 Tax=Araneus ventricosus TaxID=182803 RepID=A0A4Y2X1V5_ARAVE|nr:hypothetical protein AVEN_137466-1 [Araneus ventricosus]
MGRHTLSICVGEVFCGKVWEKQQTARNASRIIGMYIRTYLRATASQECCLALFPRAAKVPDKPLTALSALREKRVLSNYSQCIRSRSLLLRHFAANDFSDRNGMCVLGLYHAPGHWTG